MVSREPTSTKQESAFHGRGARGENISPFGISEPCNIPCRRSADPPRSWPASVSRTVIGGARERELGWSKRGFPAFRPGQDAATIRHVFLFETGLAREHRLLPTNGLAQSEAMMDRATSVADQGEAATAADHVVILRLLGGRQDWASILRSTDP